MSQVAVWGASGFIGRSVVERLLACGYKVRALCRRPELLPANWRGRVETGALEFGDSPEQIRAAIRGCECVIHCAGHTQDEKSLVAYERSVAELCRAAIACNVQRVLMLSTIAVYGIDQTGLVDVNAPLRSDSAYGNSRIRAEKLANEIVDGTTMSIVAIRVPAVVGVGMPGTVLNRFFAAIRWGVFLHPGKADAAFACIGVRRLANRLVRLVDLASPPRVCQFVDNLTWAKLADCFAEATGRRIVRVPLPGAALALRLMDAPARALGMQTLLHVMQVLSNRIYYHDDAERLDFSRDPAVPETIDDVRLVISNYLNSRDSS